MAGLAVSVTGPGCGGDTERECQFNSNCSAGRYCSSAGTCVADCTPAGGECGGGAACNSFGMCVAIEDAGAPPDAVTPPTADAFVARPDVGTDAFDSTDAGTDAGPPPEVCTPSGAGAVPTDEDRDGRIDESGAGGTACPWRFGHGQFVSQVGVPRLAALSPTLSRDGLRLYFTGYADGGGSSWYLATRSSLAVPFEAPVQVTVPAGVATDRTTVRFDELEAYVGAAGRLWHLARASTSEAWTLVRQLDWVGSDAQLSPDGLELFYNRVVSGTGYVLHASRRSTLDEEFPEGVRVMFPGADANESVGPMFAQDGLSVFFSWQGTARTFRIERAALGDTTFSASEEVFLGTTGGTRPFFSFASREVFYEHPATDTWNAGLARTQVCRDGACIDPEVSCDTFAGEARSPDRLHCYWTVTTPAIWSVAQANCVTSPSIMGSTVGHLATIHSAGEASAVSGFIAMMDGHGWIGLGDSTEGDFRWVTGEPYSFRNWRTGEPNNALIAGEDEDCAEQVTLGLGGGWNDRRCSNASVYVCERELWPVF